MSKSTTNKLVAVSARVEINLFMLFKVTKRILLQLTLLVYIIEFFRFQRKFKSNLDEKCREEKIETKKCLNMIRLLGGQADIAH